jgi:hypothetical protein
MGTALPIENAELLLTGLWKIIDIQVDGCIWRLNCQGVLFAGWFRKIAQGLYRGRIESGTKDTKTRSVSAEQEQG